MPIHSRSVEKRAERSGVITREASGASFVFGKLVSKNRVRGFVRPSGAFAPGLTTQGILIIFYYLIGMSVPVILERSVYTSVARQSPYEIFVVRAPLRHYFNVFFYQINKKFKCVLSFDKI